MGDEKTPIKPIWVLAGLLAWFLPGAGHVYAGRKVRGAILLVTIAALFWTGLAMGGAMTVDRQYEPWWFAAQMLTGVHGVAGWYMQHRIYDDLMDDPAIGPPPAKSSGRPDERQMRVDAVLREKGLVVAQPTDGVARAYSGIAGMLNLLCVFDVVILCFMGRHHEPTHPTPEGGP